MYYDNSVQTLYICSGSPSSTWRPAPGAITAGIPSGAVMFFNLASCPSGWTELTSARGRYIVGLPAGGTLAGIKGTALTDLEDRPTGQHTHGLPVYRSGSSGAVALGDYQVLNYNTQSAAAGSVAGTNAPYIQFLACQKD